MCVCVCVCVRVCACVYIYIEREREGERESVKRGVCVRACVYVRDGGMCVVICRGGRG